MPTYGLTPTGFVRKPYEQILADINRRQKEMFGEDFDNSPESVDGQINATHAQEIDEGWRMLEAVHNSYDKSKATGASLVNIAKLTGTKKRDASYSTVPCTVTLEAGTPLESGVHFAASNEAASTRWTPAEDFTAPTTGAHAVTFRAENKGPVDAGSGSITVIATPVNGWTAVTSGEVTLGRPVDDDATLRERMDEEVARAGSATVGSLEGDLSPICDVVPVVFENVTSVTDANGLPPHSVEAVVLSTSTDDEIAQVIWDNRGAGISSFGSSTGTATDEDGEPHAVRFSRVVEVDVWLEFDLVVGDDFVAEDFAAAVALEADETAETGAAVRFARMNTLAINQPNVEDVVAIRLGFTASPTLSVNLPISLRELARFDASRVSATEV